ncbi:MAG: efflux RND transporter periplasmic adaptor subunit [Solirubrobacteraceae bacterium]
MNIRIPWHILGLMAVLVAAVVAAVIELGPPTRSTRTSTEVVTAARGVVQSTVTGTGNIEPGTDVEANFQTSGTLQHVYVKDGDHVVKGQLLAALDPTAAQLTLDQAQENLTSAQDNLANAEAQTTTSGSSTSASLDNVQTSTEFVTFRPAQTPATQTTATTTATTPTSTTTTQAHTTTAPSTTTTRSTTTPSQARSGSGSGASSRSSTGQSSPGSGQSSSGSGQTNTTSAQTIAANIASAQAAVDGAEATVTNAENALHQTHLYAPATGTVVNVSDVSPGDTVSGSSSGSNASSGSTSGSLNASSNSSSSSSSGLIEIVNTGSMTMTVSFSESDISKIKVGQPANVTLDALSGVELSAHVSSVSTLGTSSSGVVSYDATLTLDQHDSRVKPGMSASAAVVTGQASGVNLPNSAVTTTGSVARVDVMRNGKVVPTTVVVGLVGDSRTQIVSGLNAGDQVQVTTTLPALGSGSSVSSSGSRGTRGGSGLGGAGRFLGGGAGRFLGGGGGGFRAGG